MGKNDVLAGLFGFAKNAALTTHAIGVKGVLKKLSTSDGAVEAVAKTIHKSIEGGSWRSATPREQSEAKMIARSALLTLADWYAEEVNERLTRAVVGERK